ncbi:MAG: SsrA-binding protein SmpB [bacterium]
MQLIAQNRKALHDYEILERFEAGISLLGTEVKALREGRANLRDSYVRVRDGELWAINIHISPYSNSRFNHEPTRDRKLLMHKREIKRLSGKVAERGLTLIPLKLYFNDKGRAKVELALTRGRRAPDKREALKERAVRREAEREFKGRSIKM